MDIPRLHGYPIDQEVVAGVRAKQRAREAARSARRSANGPTVGFRGLLQWLSS